MIPLMSGVFAALHLDNLLFLLLVAVALLFRWLASKAGGAGKESNEREPRSTSTPPASQLERRAQTQSEEERIRKFLEALGQPAGSRPPGPAQPRTNIPPRPVAPVQAPREMVAFPRTPKRTPALPKRVQQPGPPPSQEKLFRAPPPAVVELPPVGSEPPPPLLAIPVAAQAAVTDVKKAAPPQTELIALLRSPAGLRNAVVLREIFGPPRSLQPLHRIGSA
jgi:hypothetical protein